MKNSSIRLVPECPERQTGILKTRLIHWATEFILVFICFAAPYQSLGCFNDSRQISSLEDQDAILDVCFKARTNAIDKCAAAAAKRGFRVFGLRNGGECLSGSTANVNFNISGPSSDCKGDGEGGPGANQIYIFSGLFVSSTLNISVCPFVLYSL